MASIAALLLNSLGHVREADALHVRAQQRLRRITGCLLGIASRHAVALSRLRSLMQAFSVSIERLLRHLDLEAADLLVEDLAQSLEQRQKQSQYE